MPPFENLAEEGGISGDRLPKIPPQQLERSEVVAFLNYLFGDIARRPKPVRFREGAAVARFLQELAREAPIPEQRQVLERWADLIWQTVQRNARFSMSRKDEAIEFLRKHAHTYLVRFGVEPLVKYLQQTKAPTARIGREPPMLLARGIAVQAKQAGQLRDDLSERIYAGYHALRRAKVPQARRRIAKALNSHNIKRGDRGATDGTWGSDEVMERVKQYEERWKRKHAGPDAPPFQPWGDGLVNRWLFLFHSAVAKPSQGNKR